MDSKAKQTDDLRAIRTMMEKSSRFLSLSGLSGVLAGVFAIAGALFAWIFILGKDFGLSNETLVRRAAESGLDINNLLLADALVVLFLSLLFAIIFSAKKASKNRDKAWSPVTRRVIFELFTPLVSGGILILVFLYRGNTDYIVPAMLIFYGISLFGISKYTYDDVKFLGLFEILTGLVALFLPGLGLIFWTLGFGLLHIAYGTIIQIKYH